MALLSIIPKVFAQDLNDFPALEKTSSIVFHEALSLTILRNGSGKLQGGASDIDIFPFPQNTFLFSDVYESLKHCVATNDVLLDGEPIQVTFNTAPTPSPTYFIIDKGFYYTLMDKAEKAAAIGNPRFQKMLMKQPRVPHDTQ